MPRCSAAGTKRHLPRPGSGSARRRSLRLREEDRTDDYGAKAGWLLFAAALLILTPYLIVFGIGSVWMWRHGLLWFWAVGTGVPTLLGLLLAERARRLIFPRAASRPHPPPNATPAGQAAMRAVAEISRRWQAQDPPLDQPDALGNLLHDIVEEVLETVARQYHPQADRPVLQVPVVHIAVLVELVARDFRQTFTGSMPWGKTVTPEQLLWWKNKGELGWKISAYLWQINRVRRLCTRPATAMVQEVQDHWGQNMATNRGRPEGAGDPLLRHQGRRLRHPAPTAAGSSPTTISPRISAGVKALPFDQEPLQILVIGQVKAGNRASLTPCWKATGTGRHAAGDRPRGSVRVSAGGTATGYPPRYARLRRRGRAGGAVFAASPGD